MENTETDIIKFLQELTPEEFKLQYPYSLHPRTNDEAVDGYGYIRIKSKDAK